MYLASFHWCFKRAMTGYNGWERFEREGYALAALDERGQVEKHMFLNAQKQFVPLCIGTEPTQQLCTTNLFKLMDLGAEFVQIDPQLGLSTQVCCSQKHDHTPGYGGWMFQKMLEFVRRAHQAVKQRGPESAFCCSASSPSA